MKIAIDASKMEIQTKTGIESYATAVILELLKQIDNSHQVLLYTQSPLPQEILHLHPGAEERHLPYHWGWTLWTLSRAMRRDSPDVFYSPVGVLPLIHPQKSYVVIHGLEFEVFPQAYSLFRFWHLAIITWLTSKRARHIITPSASTKQDLIFEYNVVPDTVSVISSGLLPSLYENGHVSSYIQNLASEKYLFWIGSKELRKNVEMVIEVFNRIKADYPEYKLILAGLEGFGYQSIKRMIGDSPYREDIIEVGFVSNAERNVLYQGADLFLFPSWYEGFGFPVLEAMQAGIPVVSSNQSSLPEIIGNAGVLCDPDNPDMWEQKVRKLLTDSEKYQDLVEKGPEQASKFSLEDMVSQTLEILYKP